MNDCSYEEYLKILDFVFVMPYHSFANVISVWQKVLNYKIRDMTLFSWCILFTDDAMQLVRCCKLSHAISFLLTIYKMLYHAISLSYISKLCVLHTFLYMCMFGYLDGS